jgi:ABC-type Fe3+ transport system substrate-binding protein
MRTRWTRWLAIAASLTIVAAACGDDGDDGGGGADAQQEGATDHSGQSIEVAAVWGEGTGEQQRFTEILDTFAADTGADVTFTSTGDDIAAVLGPRVEGGDPPDVAILPQPGLLNDFAEQDALFSIEDIAGDEVDANYATIWRDLGSVDDTLYGLWFKAANKSTFWYNVNVLNDAGVEPPATWDELVAGAGTVSDFGVPPYAADGASGWVLSDWFENIYLRVAGPEMYDQLTNHEIPWTDESVKTALERMSDIFQGDLLAGGIDGTLQSEFPNSVTVTFAESPGAGMVYEGDFVAGVVTSETNAALETDANFFDFPSIDGSPTSVVGGGDVVVLMKDTDAGKALIEYLATPEAAEIWASQGGFTSPNQGVDLSVYPDEITRRSAEALVSAGDAFRFDLSDLQPAEFGSTAGQGIWGLLQEFVRNPDVDGTAQQLEDAAQRAFG